MPLELIQNFMQKYPMIVNAMVGQDDMTTILELLDWSSVLEGAVVELGCNVGTTSERIAWYLQATGSTKQFHVYDSFEGLPDRTEKDGDHNDGLYKKGDLACSEELFIQRLESKWLPLPVIHKGWFHHQIYPEKICFAFFDGDLYTSIEDSFAAVWPKLVSGGAIVVHDVGGYFQDHFGAQKAFYDFVNYHANELEFSTLDNLGLVRKH